MKSLIFMDIDGTCADVTKRAALAGPRPPRDNAEAYKQWVITINSGMENDIPVPGMRDFCTALSHHMPFFYLTNRGEQHREETVGWLLQNGFPAAPLLMRDPHSWAVGDGEYKASEIERVKEIPIYKDYSVIMVDDCPGGEIEEMCRSKGWTFQKAFAGRRV